MDLLIPVRKRRARDGAFRWGREVRLLGVAESDGLPLGQLARDLDALGVAARVGRAPAEEAAVRLRRDARLAPEAYRLTISPGGVEIVSATDAGAYYAVQTLRDLLAVHGRSMPCCLIEDRPDFPRRGVYLDCSRGKVPKLATLKALVERLARWKINELQLYIENVFAFARHPAIGRGYSPFLPEEIVSLRAHCERHHVRLVGSLASFGHLEKVLALPEYRRLGELPGYGGWPGGTTLCPGDPGAVRLITELYEEFVPLFRAADFNACCDETWELGKGRSRRRAERAGVGRVYLDFLVKIRRLLERQGRRMNAWSDIVLGHPELLPEVPRDIVMLNWDYNPDGERIGRTREIAEAGLPFMVCPGTSSWQTHGTRLANAVGNVARFAAAGRKFAAEGLLNTDWGDCGHRNLLGASLHGFAHGAAHAWFGPGVDDAAFTDAFCLHLFGQRDGRLAGAVRALGSSYLSGTGPHGNECGLYHALVEPMLPPRDLGAPADLPTLLVGPRPGRIDACEPQGLRAVIERLSASDVWSVKLPGSRAANASEAEFEVLALREYALAARMDVIACRRALAAKDLRAGRAVPTAALKRLADQTRSVADDFRELWLARNKPSRLRDNLALFRRAAGECDRLAGR